MWGLRPVCGDYVLYVGITSCMWGLRPVCRDYVLYVGITSCMMGLRPLCRSYLSSTSFMWGLRPVCRDYVLYDGITSCMSEAIHLACILMDTELPSAYTHILRYCCFCALVYQMAVFAQKENIAQKQKNTFKTVAFHVITYCVFVENIGMTFHRQRGRNVTTKKTRKLIY